jgi:hypothetical protein
MRMAELHAWVFLTEYDPLFEEVRKEPRNKEIVAELAT